MNFTGKVLVVLILVFSVMFMSFAMMVFATHKNWRDAVLNQEAKPGQPLGLKFQVQNAESELKDLQAQKDRLENEKDLQIREQQDLIAKLQTAINGGPGVPGLKEQVKGLETEKNTLMADLREQNIALDQLQQNHAMIREELVTLRKDLQETNQSRDDHMTRVVQLTDRVNQMELELARLQDREQQLVQQISSYRELIAYHGVSEQDRGQTPPKVEGRIVGMNNGEKLVEISIGSDDGILRGHELKVFRTGNEPRYLGLIRVVRSTPDRAVAKVVSQQGTIERNDHVATELR